MIKRTSLQAYQSITDTLGDKQRLIFYVFASHDEPLTNEEVKDILGWEINRVTPRVKELTDAGIIKVTGRKLTKSNRYAETRALSDYQSTLFI